MGALILEQTETYTVLWEAAQRACDLAFENATADLRTLKGGRSCFYPIVNPDGSIDVGVNPDYHYLIYQENGFASFPMTWAYNRVIPMWIDGRLQFRKCVGINRFQSGHKNYWQRGADGQLVPEYKQKRSWVHPGLPPKHFIADAVDEALEEYEYDLFEANCYDTLGELDLIYG